MRSKMRLVTIGEALCRLLDRATDQPIGSFCMFPLRLSKADPEVFRLALEANSRDELASMRQGEKNLDGNCAAPLLGLLGAGVGLDPVFVGYSIARSGNILLGG